MYKNPLIIELKTNVKKIYICYICFGGGSYEILNWH